VKREDPTVFVDPFTAPPDQNRDTHAGMLAGYSGCTFMCIDLMEEYIKEKIGCGQVPYGHEGPQPDPASWN
jgi:hypothetical protein